MSPKVTSKYLQLELPFCGGLFICLPGFPFVTHQRELPGARDNLSALVFCASGVVFMAGHVYAVGGFNGSLRVRTVDVYDGVKDQWTSIASMQERRSTLGAAVLNDLLYAVGGFDGSTGRSWTQSPPAPIWDTPSLQPWFAQPVLGPTSCPSIATSPRSYASFLLSQLGCQSQAFLHKKCNCPCAVISRALGRTPIAGEGLFTLPVAGNPFTQTMRLRKRACLVGGRLRTVV